MRKHEKKQCAELIKTLEEAHGEIIKYIGNKDADKAAILLQECQQAAIAIGEIIEKSEGEGTEAVSKLEEYCEYLYRLSEEIFEDGEINSRQTEKKLQKIINAAQNGINALPTRIEAVFLPYKAAMWDSLESIWMAADADPDCDAYVVPIPYFDRRSDGSLADMHYEADKYPDYVPVTNYLEFDLGEHLPDMIFIHNPYDDHNYVTTVHPSFYTEKLNTYTDCLVYVPYFATAGNLSEAQSLLPSYFRVDYIVVQSPQFIGFYDKRVPKEKFIPLGSPKFDKVIKLCENPPEPPAEWKEKLEGKRVFFYNTSINGCLEDTASFLKKMTYVFNVFKERDDACLLWRPHPLLESTMDSLRPEYKAEYLKLKEDFIRNDIGILDETADIESTIALCDAYVGDSGTSVTSLFGVVGKPMYILNNYLHEPPKDDDWLAWTSFPVRGDRNTKYCITMGNRLFVDRDMTGEYRFLCELSEDYVGGGYYTQAFETDNRVVITPANADSILLIDPETLKKEKIELEHHVDRDGAFAWSFNLPLSDHKEIFYIIPNRYPKMVIVNSKTKDVKHIKDEAFEDEFSVYENSLQERILGVRFFYSDVSACCSNDYTKNLPERLDGGEGRYTAPDGTEYECFMIHNPHIPGITLMGPKLICIDVAGKRLRAIQLDTYETEEREIGLDGLYIGLLRDVRYPEMFWFIPYSGTILCKWDMTKDTFEHIDARIEGLKSFRRPQRYECDENFFSGGTFHDNKLILSPNWANKFVELDIHTYESREWIPPLEYTIDDKNDYWKNWGIGSFYRDSFDYSCKFFYSPEHILYDVDLDKHTAIPVKKIFNKQDIFNLAAGFHRDSQWMPYVCFEDVFNSLDDIASGTIHGPGFEKDRQIEAYRTINASPSGDCGEKVFKRLKDLV